MTQLSVPTRVDTSKTYVLHNNWSGAAMILAASASESLEMINRVQPGPTPPACLWTFRETNRPGYYRLQPLSHGASHALDVVNDRGEESQRVRLARSGDFSGQFWRVDAWEVGGEGNALNHGKVRLSNMFTGPDRHLDVYATTFGPHLAGGACIGQRWTLEECHFDDES